MLIEIRQKAFQPLTEIEAYERAFLSPGKFGATASFVGTMRDYNDGESVQGMTLEHYPGMTEKHLKIICDTALERWTIVDVLLLHRVGKIDIGDPIVLVAVWTAHRGDAFDACRFIMEDLKSKAPFWKKESVNSGERWVENNTDGYAENNEQEAIK
ncbi:MAG: molybdenum cofactor biosynthesis protein MoaE [Gammaproteobacteria bacterium]|nr:molybdenum cofactor biosynthesis protein MoaE [Gammaproteobacteria bacterium]